MGLTRDDLRIKVTVEGGDRCLLIGASRTGKSTAAGELINMFYADYVKPLQPGKRPRGRILIVDTKPRWRPEMLSDGRKAKKRYKDFLAGDVIPNSRLVSHTNEWDLAWQTGEGVVIIQNSKLETNELVQWCVNRMQAFFNTQTHKTPSLLVIDEGMDFFGPTGTGRYGDIVQRSVRAGGEKGLASLTLVQRPKTINLQVLTESNYLMLFHIKFAQDMKRLQEMGVPASLKAPSEKKHFALWRNDRLLTKDATLSLKRQ